MEDGWIDSSLFCNIETSKQMKYLYLLIQVWFHHYNAVHYKERVCRENKKEVQSFLLN